MRKCSVCGEEYPVSSYKNISSKRPGAKRHQCRKCWNKMKSVRVRKYYEEWMLNLIPKYLGVDKLRCSKCGYDRHMEALEFHHTDPHTKERMVSGWVREISPWGKNTDKVYTEIDKCKLLCSTCHREEHIINKKIYLEDFTSETKGEKKNV